jgi:hypothetical protein
MLLLPGKPMTEAIHFQGYTGLRTIKIQIIFSERMLATEFVRRESTVSQ